MENNYNKKISEITSIDSRDFGYGSEEAIVKNREDLRKIIEAPCLNACLTLYDKNIRTVNSSANKREIGDNAYIGINYDSLDEDNKQILNELIKEGKIEPLHLSDNPIQRGGRDFNIEVPIFEDDTVGRVSDRFMQIASRFQEQDVLYGKHDKNHLIQEQVEQFVEVFRERYQDGNKIQYEDAADIIKECYGIEKSEDLFNAIYGYVYDEELDTYWENEELYNKHKRYQEKNRNKQEEKTEQHTI